MNSQYSLVNIAREQWDDNDIVPLFTVLVENSLVRYAWLSPEGELFCCSREEHIRLQITLERSRGITDLEQAGWIKL